MPELIAANTGDMRAKVPELGHASDVASQIGKTLESALASFEPLADWTHDEVTAQYLPVHNQIKEFVGRCSNCCPARSAVIRSVSPA